MNGLISLFSLVMVIALTACASLTTMSTKGVDDSDEELLVTVASLAKRGAQAVCNPAALEKQLGIKIAKLVVRRHEPGDGSFTEKQETENIVSVSTGAALKGSFIRFRSASTSFCSFGVEVPNFRLCDRDSMRVQMIMGTPVLYGPDSPHGTQRSSMQFEYGSPSSNRTLVVLGDTGQRCANSFAIFSNGEWK